MVVRVGIYARQSVAEDVGIAQQVAKCRNYVATKDDWQVVDTYEDNNTSATKARGPHTRWSDMIKAVESGELDAVVATRIDRMFRRMEDWLLLKGDDEDKEKSRVFLVFSESGVDTSTSYGKLMVGLLTEVAQFEIAMKRERTLPYKDTARNAGHPAPGKPPYGYSWVPASKRDKRGTRWAIVPDEAAAIRRASELLLADKERNLNEVCRKLDENPKFKPRGGGKWARSSLRHILLNPFIAGLLPPAQPHTRNAEGKNVTYDERLVDPDKCTPGAWTEILSEDDWRAARIALLDGDRLKNGGQTARKHLLGGLAICGTCGTAVRSAWTREKHRGYRCPNGHFLRRAEEVDEYVVNTALTPLVYGNGLAGDLHLEKNPEVDIQALNNRRAVLLDQQKKLTLKFVKDTLGEVEFHKLQKDVSEELESIGVNLAAAYESDPVAEYRQESALRWEDSVNMRRELLRLRFDAESLAKKRAILLATFVPIVFPVGKGWTIGKGNHGVPETISFWWKGGDIPYPSASAFPLDKKDWILNGKFAVTGAVLSLSEDQDVQIAALHQ